ncbi:EpsG family protein [Paraburkholderia fungorum]|uniref:EpsG family protein n=1 Tax=Paraburkholderia fungorum TaxID=134537 RepID=UPI002092199E|nr:EpsG family protein [Paraburkholderia fungorum]USU20968.1 EpsG family protein [Paraburkholderia fungorum]USU27036.1 EpsG family protein [Paraburkholderia fungorum]
MNNSTVDLKATESVILPLISRKGAAWVVLLSVVLLSGLFPFASFYLLLLLMTLLSSAHSPVRVIVCLLCISSIIVFGPLIALKLPINNGGNDKIQYLDFMRTMDASGLAYYLSTQPEVLSFSTMYLAYVLFGPTDLAFLFIFVISYSLLLCAVWKIEYRALPIFILLMTSSGAFYSSYANVIRQAMAFPFMFLFFTAGRTRSRLLLLMLSSLAHLPSFLIMAPYAAYRYFKKWAVLGAILMAILFFAISKYNLNALSALSGDDGGYVSKKVGLYSAWDEYSVIVVALAALALFAVNNYLWLRSTRNNVRKAERLHSRETRELLIASNFAFISLMATYNLSKVFERVYIYFFVISIAYLAVLLARMRPGPIKAIIILTGIAYSVYGLFKNLFIAELLFSGDPFGFLTSSFLELYRNFI